MYPGHAMIVMCLSCHDVTHWVSHGDPKERDVMEPGGVFGLQSHVSIYLKQWKKCRKAVVIGSAIVFFFSCSRMCFSRVLVVAITADLVCAVINPGAELGLGFNNWY